MPPRTRPAYGTVNLAVVHHTESANEYTQAQAPGVVLAITKFHRDTRGWNDVGYNYLVDRFGTIYEGRAGGVDLPVIGAHAQGFNGVSTGISVIGSFTASEPPTAAVDAVARLIGWRLPLAGMPVSGQVTVRSGGGSLAKFRAGAAVTLPRICGHRDVGSTDCPGNRLYADLGDIRTRAQSRAGTPVVRPEVTLGSAARVRYGAEARFEGSVLAPDKTPQAGVPVRIEKRGASGTWVRIADTTTDGDGAFLALTRWTRGGLARATAQGVSSLPVSIGVVPALEVAADVDVAARRRRRDAEGPDASAGHRQGRRPASQSRTLEPHGGRDAQGARRLHGAGAPAPDRALPPDRHRRIDRPGGAGGADRRAGHVRHRRRTVRLSVRRCRTAGSR